MNSRTFLSVKIVAIVILVALIGCSGGSTSPSSPATTPTPTPPSAVQKPTLTPVAVGSGLPETPTTTTPPTHTPTTSPTASPTASPCEGVSGNLEVRILVGPAAAVGLETHAVGSVPFTVNNLTYSVNGGDHISFHDVLSEDDIHYDVSFEADVVFDGVCEVGPGGTQLVLGLEMAWNQIVRVTAEDFDRTYPTSGNNTANVTLPLIDGATANVAGSEGMEVVLRLER